MTTSVEAIVATVCEMPDDESGRQEVLPDLIRHVHENGTDIVVLPEMPFSRWLPRRSEFCPAAWAAALVESNAGLAQLEELAPALIVTSRPAEIRGRRVNEGFAWRKAEGYRSLGEKRCLPSETGFYEQDWFVPGPVEFPVLDTGNFRIAIQICSDLWFNDWSRAYGLANADIIAVPRATSLSTSSRWLTAAQMAAMTAGSYVMSANRVGGTEPNFGGTSWIIDPDGEVLATTSRVEPIVSARLQLSKVGSARATYPRTLYRDPNQGDEIARPSARVLPG